MAFGTRIRLLGCPIDAVTLEKATARIDDAIRSRQPIQHMAINAAKLVKLQTDDELRAAAEACELVTADGQAVVWASRLLGRPLPERVAGIDLLDALLERAVRSDYGVFLLGARPQVVEDAAVRMRRKRPGLRLVGYHHGYFRPEEEGEVVAQIERAAPDLLFVALETPFKELFLARHKERLGTGFTMGVGGSFDVIAGVRRRAPLWMQRAGLEWLCRFAQEPRRLARRYVVGNTQFALLVLRAAVRRGSE